MQQKRPCPPTEDDVLDKIKHLKRCHNSIEDISEQFICPITQELLIEPVTAADGHLYERAAIEKWLEARSTSPMTNQPMGPNLIPALQACAPVGGDPESEQLPP